MFISNEDKQYLFDKAKLAESLIKEVSLMASKITSLTAKVLILEQELVKPKKVKKPLTAAQKAKQREYQKAYNERQKIKKLEAELATIGNTNVSA
jgi:hypothetical protein